MNTTPEAVAVQRSTPTTTPTHIPIRTLTTWKIIVLIIGAMTPLAVVVGTVPLGFAFGGPSMTVMFIVAGIVIGLFCVGYSQMVRRITRPGAFYNYIARGLGRPAGVGAAITGSLGYIAGFTGAAAIQGFITHEAVLALTGADIPWWVFHIVQLAIVGVLVWRQIDLSAYLVSIIVVVEVLLLLALSISIIGHEGVGAALPLDVFSPDAFTIGAWSVAFIFAILTFQGYESAALYAPEAKRPEKTIPRALYGALGILVVILVFATWTLTSITGIETLSETVLEQGLSGFVFGAVATYLGPVGLVLFTVASILATLAVTITIANFMSRYLNSVSREGLLPGYLSRVNRHGAPHTAQLTLLGLGTLVPIVVFLLGMDPYTQLSSVMFGIGAIVATLMQGLASASVVAFFLRRRNGRTNVWTQTVVPVIATLLLGAALIVQLMGYQWITGIDASWTMVLPALVFVVLIGGILFGFWLRKGRPEIYDDISAGDNSEEAAAIRDARIARTAGIELP